VSLSNEGPKDRVVSPKARAAVCDIAFESAWWCCDPSGNSVLFWDVGKGS